MPFVPGLFGGIFRRDLRTTLRRLEALATEAAHELQVAGQSRDAVGVQRGEVGVAQQGDHEGLRCLLDRRECGARLRQRVQLRDAAIARELRERKVMKIISLAPEVL